ncbi:hypothetical protein [Leptospira noguchii]|uniref:hypothetical protein n=1 Tax=Leptospira noguchii TaxID=28182 RepID=UPI002FCD21A8
MFGNFKLLLFFLVNRVVEKFQSENSQNCFNYPFQYNRNRSRINFLTTLIIILKPFVDFANRFDTARFTKFQLIL